MPVPQNFGDASTGLPDTGSRKRQGNNATQVKKSPPRQQQEAGDRIGSRDDIPCHESHSRQEIIARIKQESRPAGRRDIPIQPRPTVASTVVKEDARHPAGDDARPQVNKDTPTDDMLNQGLAIQRPRSALHAGDFREQAPGGNITSSTAGNTDRTAHQRVGTSPPAPWTSSFTTHLRSSRLPGSHLLDSPTAVEARRRAASQTSLSSSFLIRPPTSPLALQANTMDSDDDRARSRSPIKSRRRTFSPGALREFQSSPSPHALGGLDYVHGLVPHLERGHTLPRRSHRSSRSISSIHPLSTPQTPPTRSRRGSLMSDNSPFQRARMVGSYEESILRGRMSSLPSEPLNFVAQVGVLGKGHCKPSLRCPPHISVPFPAVFYEYGQSSGGTEAGPSPYVGMVDLEHRESAEETATLKAAPHLGQDSDGDVPMLSIDDTTGSHSDTGHRKQHRRKTSKSTPVGSYRIPQQGQLQVIIRNPSKTAVKLFLIPYDLSDMQPGQKTFIRQRSYSAGPILDMPLNARSNLGTDRPEAALSASDDPNDRPVLRYLIHLHICRSSRGKFYLYKSIRIVFANRVPDGKEKLRHEVQLPQPKYSTYKHEVEQASSHPSPALTRPRTFSLVDPPSTLLAGYEQTRTPAPPSHRTKAAFSFSTSYAASATPNATSPETARDEEMNDISPRSSRTRQLSGKSNTSYARPPSPERSMSFERQPTPTLRGGRDSPSPARDSLIGRQLDQLKNNGPPSPPGFLSWRTC